VELLAGDWFGPVAGRRFLLVVANPPYVAAGHPHLRRGDLRHEPREALVAGPDGLAAVRAIAAGAPGHLDAGGWLLLEHGWDQGPAVREILTQAGFGEVFTRRDLAGRERVTGGGGRA
jgi:release factor glutamine methyltransferase